MQSRVLINARAEEVSVKRAIAFYCCGSVGYTTHDTRAIDHAL